MRALAIARCPCSLRKTLKKEAEEIGNAYKDMLKRATREQPIKKTDPWGICALA